MRLRISVCLPATCVCFLAASAAPAATIVVPAGGDFQAALNQARPGDVITLEPNATYIGNFVLPNKGTVTDYITIRSAAPATAFPPAGVRITPAYAARLPKIRSPNILAALQTAAGANHYKLMFLEFQANESGAGDIISIGAGDSTQTELSQVPYGFILDRLYVHGDPELGQKRGIALHSRDTTVMNSWVSDCKAINQESQAIGGFNGPGNWLIENNYLEAATQNFLLGGSDPPIPNLVTTHVVFRSNHLSKRLAWRDPILAAPANVTAAATPAAGALPAGTYSYQVAARKLSNQNRTATSVASAGVTATLVAGGAVTISWTPVAGSQEYVVYGRTSNGPTMFWTTPNPFFTDTGAAGAAGKPGSATKWQVKNIFELKNAQDVLVEGNVFENLWMADQPGYPIVLTPRNQGGAAPWVVVQHVTFRHNIVRHTAGGVNILGTDNVAPSRRTNNIVVRNNLFDDLTSATWGSGGKVFQVGDGPEAVTIDHNTVFTTDSTIVGFYGAPTLKLVYTNNMSPHNVYGINGSNSSPGLPAIMTYAPDGYVCANILAGGAASKYPACDYFPTVAEWLAGFVDHAGGDYRLLPGFASKYPSTDGLDLGADIDTLTAMTDIALRGGKPVAPVKIETTSLPNGVLNEYYQARVTCSGGSTACAWRLRVTSHLPAGMLFDPSSATLFGTPTVVETGSVTVQAYDPNDPTNAAEKTFSFEIRLPASTRGSDLVLFAADATVIKGTWSLVDDSTAAGGRRIANPNASVAKIPAALASPANYFELTFRADAGIPYHLWMRGKAESNYWGNDSVYVQFSGSVDVTGAPIHRIGSAMSTTLTLEEASNAGLSQWGWADDAYGGFAGPIYFETTGTQTIRVQVREDGLSIDQIVLGGATYLAAAPGAATNDTTILERAGGASRTVVLYTADAAVKGTWSLVDDPTAAGGHLVANPDAGAAKLAAPLASPQNYFELTFAAEAGVGYHLWMRGKAARNLWSNDSVYVQFSGSVDGNGLPTNRIGSTAAAPVSIEEGTGAGLSDWGWADDSYGGLAAPIYFASTGTQTIRVQVREDGVSLDQIVLSADRYLTVSPGASKNDSTIVMR